MSSDVFRRVGRGGAGNWYSQKDFDEASKSKPEDVEAQNVSGTTATPNMTTGNAGAYSRAGRGGAGNFYDSKEADEARRQQQEDHERTKAAVTASQAKPKAGLSGRGGMGNWSDSSALTAQAEQQEKKKREDLEARILEDVDAGLAPPPPAYHQGREQDG